jgi:hypothetical protein
MKLHLALLEREALAVEVTFNKCYRFLFLTQRRKSTFNSHPIYALTIPPFFFKKRHRSAVSLGFCFDCTCGFS